MHLTPDRLTLTNILHLPCFEQPWVIFRTTLKTISLQFEQSARKTPFIHQEILIQGHNLCGDTRDCRCLKSSTNIKLSEKLGRSANICGGKLTVDVPSLAIPQPVRLQSLSGEKNKNALC